jgi:hypothetical protein
MAMAKTDRKNFIKRIVGSINTNKPICFVFGNYFIVKNIKPTRKRTNGGFIAGEDTLKIALRGLKHLAWGIALPITQIAYIKLSVFSFLSRRESPQTVYRPLPDSFCIFCLWAKDILI